MSRDILDEEPIRRQGGNRADCGGYTMKDKIDVRNYQAPQGPKGIMDKGVGLHGTVHSCGSQGHYSDGVTSSGRPGLGGERFGNGGTQGRR